MKSSNSVLTLLALVITMVAAICPKDNLFPAYVAHENSKSQFYRCLNGHATLLQCRRGQQYDALTEKCVRSICQEEDDHYLPYPYDCTKFYQCSNGQPILMPCAPGTEFDAELNVCNYPEVANCTAIPRPQARHHRDSAEEDDYDWSEKDSSDNNSTICEDDIQYAPYPYDCTKFYECSNGEPILMPCAPGTEFDATLNVCNYPEVANCSAIPKPEEDSSFEEEGSDELDWSDEDENNNGTICREGDTYLSYPYDCTKFYQCSNGEPILMPCAPGTEFDASLNPVCNYPEAANCIPVAKPTEEDDDNSIFKKAHKS